MAEDKPLSTLYQSLRKSGYDVPDSYDQFEHALTAQGKAGSDNRHALYTSLFNDGYDVPTSYADFYSGLFEPVSSTTSRARGGSSPAQQVTAAATPAQQKQPPKARPQGTPMTERERLRMSLGASDMAYKAGRSTEDAIGRVGRMAGGGALMGTRRERNAESTARLLGSRTDLTGLYHVSGGQTAASGGDNGGDSNEDTMVQSPKPYGVVYENGKPVTQWLMPDGSITTNKMDAEAGEAAARRSRLTHAFNERMRENGLDMGNPEDVQRQALMDYDAPLSKAVGEAWRKAEERQAEDERRAYDKASGESGSGGVMGAIRALVAANQRGVPGGSAEDYQRDLDIAVRRNENFDMERMAREVYDSYGKANGYSMDDVRRAVFRKAAEARAPKGTADFLARKIADQPLLSQSQATELAAAGRTGGYGLAAADATAMGEYGNKHGAADVTGTVLNMAIDPVTYMSAGVGNWAARKAMGLAGKQMLKGATKDVAERYASRTLTGRLIGATAGGAANFSFFETAKGAQQQMQTGSLSASDLLKATGRGLLLGGATGVLSPVIGNVADKVVKTTTSTAGKVGIRAGEQVVSTIAEGTVFSLPEWVDGERNPMDVWRENMAMMIGFKASHAVKSAPQVIAGLRPVANPRTMQERNENRKSFAERLGERMGRGSADMDFSRDELQELADSGYGDLARLFVPQRAKGRKGESKPRMADGKSVAFEIARHSGFEEANAERVNPEFDGYADMEMLMQDKSVSQSTRAKAYYILTGHTLPMGTVVGYTREDGQDGRVAVSAMTGDGEVVTRRTFDKASDADRYKDAVRRQAELNSVDMGERYREAAADMAVVQSAVEQVAPGADFETVMRNYKAVKEGDADAVRNYGEMAKEIDKAIEANKGIADAERPEAIRSSIREETGVDVDGAIKKEPGKRNEQEQAAVEDYVKRLFPEEKGEEAGTEQPMSGDESEAADIYDHARLTWEDVEKGDPDAKAEMDDIIVRMQEAYQQCEDAFGADAEWRMAEMEDDPWGMVNSPEITEYQQDAVLEYIKAKAAMDGVQDASDDAMERKHNEAAASVERHTHRDSGMVQPATMKEDDRPVYIVKGNVVAYPDGSGIDRINSDQSIVICDAETGEYEFTSPEQILNMGETIDPQAELDEAYANIEAEHEAMLGGTGNEEETPSDTEAAPATEADAATVEQPQMAGGQEQTEEANDKPYTALSQIPVDEKTGEPKYEQVSPALAWDAIVEQTGGNEQMAKTVADSMVADKEAALKKAEKAKAKQGGTIAEKIAAEQERQQAIDNAKAELEHWQSIAMTQQRRRADAERVKADEARKVAESRAEEEAKAKAEREEAERKEREAINGVPDWVDDTPQNARARGFRRSIGGKFDRQQPLVDHEYKPSEASLSLSTPLGKEGENGVTAPIHVGKEVDVKFTDKVKQKGRVAVVEASSIQPSHYHGQPNVLHFIPEAQPKKRTDDASVTSAEDIAANINPEEITSSVTAYTGAPTLNARGETIQGNNRSAALKQMWESHPEQAAKYKQYLMDHAEEYGLKAEDIAQMQQPVLANIMDVDDAKAIELGQYDVKDTESGGTERIKAKNAVVKMGDDMKHFANVLLSSSDDEASFSQLVDKNGTIVLKWMNQKGYITPTQYKSAFDSKGNITAEAANDLKNIMYQSIFTDGNERLEEVFNTLPAKAQRAILVTMYRDYDSPETERMVTEVQNSIMAYNELMQNDSFANAKNMKEAQMAVMMWQRQYQFDDATGESYLPTDKYSNFALQLAAMYRVQTQGLIQGTFNQMFDLIQGTQEATLFNQDTLDNTPRTLVEAIKEALNIDYNGQQRSNVLAGDSSASQQRRQGSRGDAEADGRGKSGNEPAKREGGTGDIDGRDAISKSDETEDIRQSEKISEETEESVGRSLTKDEADELLSRMENNAEVYTEKELTAETWNETFDENNSIDTPIGRVKMGENQITKFFEKNRTKEFGMVGPTLSNPDVIIEENSEAKDGESERPSSFLFVKTFNRNGEKIKFFASITVKQDGLEVSVSSHYINKNRIGRAMQEGKVLYTREALLPNSSEWHLAEHQENDVPDLLPTQENNASADKVTNKGGELQTNNEKSADKHTDKKEAPTNEAGAEAAYTIEPSTYTNKKGKTSDVSLLKFNGELSPEQERAVKEFAKERMGEGRFAPARGWKDRESGGWMFRNEEDARKAAEMVGNDEAVADAQPMTAEELRDAVEPKQEKPKRTSNQPKPANKVERVSAAEPANEEKPTQAKQGTEKKLVITDEMKADEDVLREILGIGDDELDIGMMFRDPDELTPAQRRKVYSAGVNYALGYIDQGFVSFPEFAKAMSSRLGYKIKPWLKSLYEGAKRIPGYEDMQFTPTDEVDLFDVENFDKPQKDVLAQANMIVEEGKAQVAADKATKELKTIRNEQRKEADEQRAADTVAVAEEARADISQAETDEASATDGRGVSESAEQVDDALDKVNNQLALLGYYAADRVEKDYNEAYGYMRNAEKKAVKDAANLADNLIDDLGLDRFEATHEPNLKGGIRKKKPLAVANIAPAGGDIAINLPLNDGRELYVGISLSPATEKGVVSINGDNLQADSITYRVNNPNGNGGDRYGNNVWVDANVPYGELLKGIQRAAYKYLPGNSEAKDGEYHSGDKVQYSPDGGKTWHDAVVVQPNGEGGVRIDTGQAPVMYVNAHFDQLRHKAEEPDNVEKAVAEAKAAKQDGKSSTALMSDAGTSRDEQEVRAALGKTFKSKNGLTLNVNSVENGQVKATITDLDGNTDEHIMSIPAMADALQRWEEVVPSNENKPKPEVKKPAKKVKPEQQVGNLFAGMMDEEPETDTKVDGNSNIHRTFANTVKNDMLASLDNGTKPYRGILDLRKRAKELGMDVDNDGRTDILLQELVEDGLVRAAREVTERVGSGSKEAYDLICKLYDLQPTISARSSNRIKMQQYSTPLPMAWNADHFAMHGKDGGLVLEPTAGNGMLVFGVPAKQVHANELDETRLANLREQGFAEVTQQDATEPFEGGQKYDAIISNPPFGKREAAEYDGKMIGGLDPQITLNALASMKDDGRAAIIIGGNMEYAANGGIKNMKPFFTYLYDHYNVKGVVDMDGKLYAKQGTTFPTRMILIDGRRSDEERAQSAVYPPVKSKAVRKAESFEDLYNIIDEITNSPEKTNGTEILRSQQGGLLPVADKPSGTTDGERHRDQHPQNDGDELGRRRGGKPDVVATPKERERVLRGEQRENNGNGVSERRTGGDNGGESRGNTGPVVRGVDGVGVSTDGVGLAPTVHAEPKKRGLTDEKIAYRPHSTAFSLESVAPAAMVEAMDNVLTQIEKEHGSIDNFVTKELGYDSVEDAHHALAAEQMDSVAMAVYQMKHGQALIIGDQTGVGKGRQMAALIRWAVNRGEKPVFITQKADLFSDIYRDLVDVGSGDLVPFIFNSPTGENKGEIVDANGKVVYKGLSDAKMKKVMANGKLPDGYDFAVLTYSQVNTGDEISQKEFKEAAKRSGTRTKKSKSEGKPTPKATFLRAIAKDNYLFLDESHTAAGTSNTGAYLQSILRSAKAATFASATFAKRPDTMPLYAIRTAMSQANVEPVKMISIIEKGGVTLQEIMSRELTNAGQMVRRERDMSDVRTDWKTIDDAETVRKARENYDKTIAAFNAIIKFQEDYVKPMIEGIDQELAVMAQSAGIKRGTNKLGVDNVPFASKTYNYTKQLMLALKVDAIADEVEKEINAGRHPVIALESTMESSIDGYNAGDVVEVPTFSASLLKGLDSVMQYTIKDENGKEQHYHYLPSDLGEAGEKAYYDLRNHILDSTSDIFISPIDAIIDRLHEKGYKVGELTGRNMYVERGEDGKVVVKRRTDKDKKRMQREFNNGELDVLILNKSASTGISLHASEKFSDQRQRSMIIAQPLSDINDYMQMIGRIDRTGQVHRGYYINLGLPVPAENRFLMMLSTKLKSLNANTTTSQDSESNEVDAPDLLNKYGSQVVVEYLRDNPEVYEKMGAPLKKGGLGGDNVKAKDLDEYKPQEDDARKITGYVALLSTKEQEDFYDDVVRRYNELIKYLNDTGNNDLKITVMPLRAKTLEKRVSSAGIDPNGNNPFAQNSYVEKVEMDVLRKPMKADDVRKTIEQVNKGKSPEDYMRHVVATINAEDAAKLEAEDARYEKDKQSAQESIAKQAEKINAQKKRTTEEKASAIATFTEEKNAATEAKHKQNVERIKANSRMLKHSLNQFEVGKSYLVPDNLESQMFDFAAPAIFCGYKTKDSKITASTTLAVFATLDGRRRVEVKLSQLGALQSIDKMTNDNWDSARSTTLDNWDSQIPTETRKEGYIMTGNILQAIADTQDERGGYPGQLISYTDIDGNVHDGILMPDKWNSTMLKSSGVPLISRMQQIKDFKPVTSHDGKVEITGSAWTNMYYLTVPKTKKEGGIFFENKILLGAALGNNFYPYHGKLRADISGKNIESVVKELTRLGVKAKDDNPASDTGKKFRLLEDDDPKAQELEALPDSELVPVYRNVQAFQDDALGSPMAFFDAETGERRTLEGGKWNYSNPPQVKLTEEQQRKLDELNTNGYLMVDGKKTTELPINDGLKFVKPKTKPAQLQYFLKKNPEDKGLWAAYDPYDHAIETPLNTQFGEAYKRPNLVVVRSLIPKSEIDEPFHADYALYPTGAHQWNNGRTLYLSRWSKIDKVLSREEEAKLIDEYWKKHPGKREALKTHRDYNRFVPEVRKELEKMGYRFEHDGKELTPEESLALDQQREADVIPGREGHLPYITDEDIERINAKMAGKWVGEPKEAMENEMAARVEELSEKLGTPVHIIRTDDEVAALPTPRQRRQKGSFNSLTGEVTIVVPNNANLADIENTFIHEVVGHDGLRVLFPTEEKLNNALDELYRVSNDSIKQTIDRMAQKMYDAEVNRLREKKRKEHEAKGEDVGASYYADMAEAHAEASKKRGQFKRDATEEYGADLAGRIGDSGFEKMSAEELTFWGKLKAMLQKALQKLLAGLKIPGKKAWGDKEWAFVQHEAYKRKKNGGQPTVFDTADTEVMKRKTGFDEAMTNGDAVNKERNEELNRVNERFNEQVVRLTEENADKTVLSLGRPSAVLQSAGVKDKPMKLYGNKVMKKMRKHGFALEELRDLPKAVANPIAVFNNYQREGNRSILTELETKDGKFLVTLELGKERDIDFNIVSSVFGKGFNKILDWYNKGYATYIDKEKALSFLYNQSAPIAATAANAGQSSSASFSSASQYVQQEIDKQVLNDATKVVENFENPKVSDENVAGNEGLLFRDGDMGLDETITKMKLDAAAANADNWQSKQDAMRAIGGNLDKLRQAMARQREYDLSTVKSITDLAKTLLDHGLLDDLSKYETKRILSAVNNAHGRQDVSGQVQKVMDIMVDNQLRMGANALGKLLSIRGNRVDARGIEVQGQLDPDGQTIAKVVRKAVSLPKADIEERISDTLDRMGSDDQAVADEAALENAGLLIAHQYAEDITESKSEEKALRDSLKQAKEDKEVGMMDADAYDQYVEATNDAIRQNKIERAEAYQSIVERVGGVLGESVERAKAWREAEKQRVEAIHHNANSDMKGRPTDEHHKESKAQKIANDIFVRFFLAPLGTFDQMLRMFGSKSVNGEGYLWNRYMRGWVDATEKEYTGYQNALKTLDEKVSDVFGKKMKWGDLFALERKLPKATVTFWDGGKKKDHELTQGNLLYIYMVDKMADGRMKLRRMGITEEDVEGIKDFVDPRFIELADWMQDEFLVQKRNEYNEVHKRMFGASMAAIENYFPLKILANARIEDVDVADDTTDTALPATSTGSIIKRRRNNLALDVMGADAFSVILDHVQQMERWASFAEFNRDLNTLLSYKRFRNQVMNMTSVYGGGKTLWNNFRNVCSMAAGAYRPPVATLDKAAVNFAKGVTAAKVSFRVFTALKQFLSMPAYLSDSSPVHLAANIANPIGAWKWSMANLPLFEKRWKSRMSGDPRLMKSEMDWKMWQNHVVEIASRIGMSPNAFVDALTVSIGAHSMYQTKKQKYLRYGYDEETAEKRAKQDATILFNQTQQSSESAFLSTMQADRSWLSVLFTIFRNSSMSYTRQLYDAIRNIKHRFEPGYKGLTEEYMAKQMRRDGIDPDKADANAKSEYRRSLLRDIARVGVFGFALQLAWNLGAYLPYLLFGDDKDEKSDMWHDIFSHTMFGSIEGLTGGDVVSAIGNSIVQGKDIDDDSNEKEMPLVKDLNSICQKWGNDNVSAINDAINLLVQSGVGVNPQSLTDAVVAIMDYCGDDANTIRECALLITRIVNCPKSQTDKVYFDEIGATAEEGAKMTPAKIAERYARYKLRKDAPLTGWLYSDAAKDSVMEKNKDYVLKEAKQRISEKVQTERVKKLLSEYDTMNKEKSKLRKLKDTDEDAYYDGLDSLYEKYDYDKLELVKQYKSDMNKLTNQLLNCKTPEEMESIINEMFAIRDELIVGAGVR